MNRAEIVSIIEQEKIVAILRTNNQQDVATVVKNVVLGGVKVLEITSNTPGFLEEISKVKNNYPSILIGAGTVLTVEIAKNAIKAGAQFLVTPNVNIDVIKIAHSNNVPVLMGAYTPTEVCLAHENGADMVKLFPAGIMGVAYFQLLKGPLNDIKYCAVAGVNVEEMKSWLDAGIQGIGYGCVILNETTGEIDFEAVKHTAQQFVLGCKNYKS